VVERAGSGTVVKGSALGRIEVTAVRRFAATRGLALHPRRRRRCHASLRYSSCERDHRRDSGGLDRRRRAALCDAA
jgi:hypothetical protein